jgi:two-component system cell cycle response regulator
MPSESELEAERNRVVVQLAGAVAHKLKQPLAVAWGYLELLLDDPAASASLDPTTQRYLAEIQDALRTMDDVINKLQQATVHHTRPYAGSQEILDLDPPRPVP